MCETKTVWHKYPDEKPYDDYYNVTVEEEPGLKYVITATYDLDRNEWLFNDQFELNNVIAWSELPDPFDEDEDENEF